jgi:hypothetical protein
MTLDHDCTIAPDVLCSLCRQRKARRYCPALGYQICAVCCGTKRLTEIRCPSDCPYLASAREHPAAAVVRRQQHDVQLLVDSVRDFNDRQSQLFFLVATFLIQYEPPELHALYDADVAEAATALAATFDTASRGVIYEHRAQSLPAERLAAGLKPVLLEAGKSGGTAFERDAAVVLKRIAEAAAAGAPDQPRRFIDLLRRVIRKPEGAGPDGPQPRDAPRLIVP